MMTRISIAQMNIEPGKPAQNYEKGIRFIEKAVSEHASLILLPELWTSGFDLENAAHHANSNRKLLRDLQKKSKQLSISIAGSYLSTSKRGITNSLILLSPDHPPIFYAKLHLFPSMDECRFLVPGIKSVRTTFNDQVLGLAICYDLRFPDLFWQYSHAGVTSFLLPAQWPLSRISHWDILSRCRAVENQAYFIGCNAVGIIGKTYFGGSSCIIHPDGSYAAHASSQEEELLTADIDINTVVELRKRFPVLQ